MITQEQKEFALKQFQDTFSNKDSSMWDFQKETAW